MKITMVILGVLCTLICLIFYKRFKNNVDVEYMNHTLGKGIIIGLLTLALILKFFT